MSDIIKPSKYRYLEAILYEPPEIKNIPSPKWAFILHDRDVNSDGSDKKPHYHLLMEFVNPRTIKSVAKDLGVGENMIEKVRNIVSARAYLLHNNAKDKAPYDKSEVTANYDFENADKPLSFIAIHNMVKTSSSFEHFIFQISDYNIPQNLATYSQLLNIWQRSNSESQC